MNKNYIGLFLAGAILLSCKNADSSKDIIANSKDISNCIKVILPPVIVNEGMSQIGSNLAYPEERPERTRQFASFEIDAHEVTNRQFSTFVENTGYVTDAEKPQEGFNVPGGAVFLPPSVSNPSWWRFIAGANWRHPDGPDSTIQGRELDPVVQVTLNDARAYAKWAKRRLPKEGEWEFAAKAGADTLYIWGDERAPEGKEKANTWQGAFPLQNTAADGFGSRAPIGCFEPNGFDLYDMIGNVWEWTDTEWSDDQSYVIKGGSFLCAENYCRRYRASARQAQDANLSTNHIGFRTVKD